MCYFARINVRSVFVRLFLFLLSFLCYSNSLNCGFAFDDASAIVSNKDLRGSTPLIDLFKHDFWGTPLNKEHSHKSYRPLTVLTFRLNYFFNELSPFGYHLVNILLHGLVVCMFNELLNSFRNLSFGAKIAASSLFAVHPIHTEAVTGLVGRAELLSALFYLFSLLILVKCRSALLPVILICIGTFCKEQAITGIGVCVAWLFFDQFHDFRFEKAYIFRIVHQFWKTLAIFSLGTITILVLRFSALLGSLPFFTSYDNPAASSSFPQRHLTYNYLLALNSWLLICPDSLCADWTMGTVPLISKFDVRIFFIVIFWLIFVTFCIYAAKNRNHQAFNLKIGLVLLVFPFIPSSNLFFPVGFVVAERVVYLPSMGYCILVALGWQNALDLFPTRKTLLKASMIFCCVTFSSKTFLRNFDWQSELSLFLSGLKVTQENAKIFNNVGHALEAQGLLIEALPYFTKATVVQPDDVGSLMNVGRTLVSLKQLDEAETHFLKAKSLLTKDALTRNSSITRIAPAHLNVFINLGEIYKLRNRTEDAEQIYRQAIRMRPDFVSAYMNLGDLLLRNNRIDDALAIFTTGLEFDPQSADLMYDAGIVHLKKGETKVALNYFERALTVDPDHVMSLINSAFIIEELSKNEHNSSKQKNLAIGRLKKASKFKPNDSHLFLHLGNLQFECELYSDALISFRTATTLDVSSKIGLQNLASVEVRLGLIDEALNTLNTLLNKYPNNIKAFLTMCDIYSNRLKNMTAAEICYQGILNHDQHHVQARHNLCIILINAGKRVDSERCVIEAKLLVTKDGPYTIHLYKILFQKLSDRFKNI